MDSLRGTLQPPTPEESAARQAEMSAERRGDAYQRAVNLYGDLLREAPNGGVEIPTAAEQADHVMAIALFLVDHQPAPILRGLQHPGVRYEGGLEHG